MELRLYIAHQERGHADIIRLLIASGVKINMAERHGASPLFIAEPRKEIRKTVVQLYHCKPVQIQISIRMTVLHLCL